MKILYSLFAFAMLSCHSQKQLIEKPLKAENAVFQKFLPGDGGGKGIQFFIELAKYPEILTITDFRVNDTKLDFNLVGFKDGVKLEALCFYENPERNPDAKNSQEEFEKAPIFRAKNYLAIIEYQIGEVSDTLQIRNFSELEIQMYP